MQPDPQALDLIWGCAAIGQVLGIKEGMAKYLLTKGEIPGRKVGGRWVASRSALRRHFEGERADV